MINRMLLGGLAGLLVLLSCQNVKAGVRVGVGIGVGVPMYGYGSFYRPYIGYPYYPPTVVVVPAPRPPVYIVQPQAVYVPPAPANYAPLPQYQQSPQVKPAQTQAQPGGLPASPIPVTPPPPAPPGRGVPGPGY